MAKEKRDAVADSLRCFGFLEEKTSLLYRNLAERVDLPFVRSLLLHIAYDSQKYSAVLLGIADTIGKSKTKTKDCQKRLGPTGRVIDDLAREISESSTVSRESIPTLAQKLRRLESTAGEEYYVLTQLKTLQYLTKEVRETYNVDLEDLKDIFESIIRDEEVHAELLSRMIKFVVGDEKKTEKAEPAVKYLNPDAWSRMTPDSVYEGAS
jgi:rubrerythrin